MLNMKRIKRKGTQETEVKLQGNTSGSGQQDESDLACSLQSLGLGFNVCVAPSPVKLVSQNLVRGQDVRSEGRRFILVNIQLPEDKESNERGERALRGERKLREKIGEEENQHQFTNSRTTKKIHQFIYCVGISWEHNKDKT